MRLPFVIHITREKCQVCLYDGPGFSLLCAPPPHTDCLKSLGESRKVCTPLQGRQRILNPHWGVLLLLRQSPPPQVSARVFSGRISGVCLQWCIRCASQVFACKGIFRVHLRCLPARVFSGCISGVCLQRCIRCASQVFAIDGNGHRPCKRLWHSQPFLT